VETHWRNGQEIDEAGREAAVRILQQLAATHRDLIDRWVDVEAPSSHHRLGRRRVEIRCQARGADLVVHGEAEQIGFALREALRAFERKVKRVRTQAPSAAALQATFVKPLVA
jgi:ribosome-associated translation inhibitor RaiA